MNISKKGLSPAPKAYNVGEEFNLRWREVAVCAINLAENATGVDEQHLVTARPRGLAFV